MKNGGFIVVRFEGTIVPSPTGFPSNLKVGYLVRNGF